MSTATGFQYDTTNYPMRAFLVVLEIGEEKETIVFSSQFQALFAKFCLENRKFGPKLLNTETNYPKQRFETQIRMKRVLIMIEKSNIRYQVPIFQLLELYILTMTHCVSLTF